MALPQTALTVGSVAGWQLASPIDVAEVAPEVGDAATGSVALGVDAPVVDAPVQAASAPIQVVPGETYTVSANVRMLTAQPTVAPVTLQVGTEEIAVPKLTAEWTEITGSFTAGESTETVVALRVDAPVTGFAIDDITVASEDGKNVVPNPSFDDVTYANVLVNSSLLMRTDTAALAVVLPAGDAQWSISQSGIAVAKGTIASDGKVTSIPVSSLGQGYYTIDLTDSAGVVTSAPFGTIDSAAPISDSRFGVGVHVEDEWYVDAARYARSVGVAEVRNDVLWRLNETSRGVYDWAPAYVDGFDKMHRSGIKILGIINYGNKLYSDNDKVPDNPEAVAAYGRYAAAVAERFDLVGVEAFNEFNHERFNKTKCGTDPSCYVPLLQAVHDSVRAIDPTLPVVAGATANYDPAWFNELWKDGGLSYADAVSFHPYQVTGDPNLLTDIIASSREGMQEFAGFERPIWITELGSTSNPAAMTVEQQADFLLKSTVTALGNGAEKFFWYDLINDSTDPTSHEGNFGLFFQPIVGVAALPPKPAAFSYALLISLVRGTESAVPVTALADDVIAYDFGSGDEKVTVAWGKTADTSVTVASENPIRVIGADGASRTVRPVNGNVTFTVPLAGVYVLALPSAP
ncbi:glycosyl hydrolase [Microbacterium sp. NPDC076895]|uniref:glycosyl hydrolase n=1 Tax=Microbacterium sp. NPDC076895 TaxID=3154957 RepID=UPI00342609B5